MPCPHYPSICAGSVGWKIVRQRRELVSSSRDHRRRTEEMGRGGGTGIRRTRHRRNQRLQSSGKRHQNDETRAQSRREKAREEEKRLRANQSGTRRRTGIAEVTKYSIQSSIVSDGWTVMLKSLVPSKMNSDTDELTDPHTRARQWDLVVRLSNRSSEVFSDLTIYIFLRC